MPLLLPPILSVGDRGICLCSALWWSFTSFCQTEVSLIDALVLLMYRGKKKIKKSDWKKLPGLPSPACSIQTATQQMFNAGHLQSTYCSPGHFPPPVRNCGLPCNSSFRQLHTRNIRLLMRPHFVLTWQGHPNLSCPVPVLLEQINFSHHLCPLLALSKDLHGLKNKFTHRLEGKGQQRNSITASLRTAALEEVGCLRCFKAQR